MENKKIVRYNKAANGKTVQHIEGGRTMKRKCLALLLAAILTLSAVSFVPALAEDVNYFGFDEPFNIKIGVSYAAASDFTFYGGETVENNAWMDLYKANNIFPEILYEVDPSQANTKLSTAIMSGDYPDVFRVSGGDYKNFVQSGAVADITEAYEKYASDELKEFMNFDGGLAVKSLYVDGKLYGLPKVNDTLSNAYMMWIRQDWLDRLGLQIPTTMEELKAVAHAFTYDDPDGDGQNNTYGIAFDGMDVLTSSIGSMHPFFEGFGVYLGNNGLSYIEDENGNITWGGANAEGMKAALSMLQEMYADGAIARDFITMDSQSIFSETKAGRVGIWFGPTWGAMEPAIYATQNDKNCHIVAAIVPTATGETTKSYATAAANEIYCVSSKCAKPELLVKLWNLNVHYMNAQFCTAEEFNMYYGDSANYSGWKTAIIPAGGFPNGRETYALLTEALATGDTSKLSTKQLENYTSIKTYMDAVAAGTHDPADATQQRGLSLYTVYADPLNAWTVITKLIAEDDYMYTAYSGIPSEEVSSMTGTLKKLLVEEIIKVITGDKVESYDSFVNTWYAMGGQDAIDEANENR